MKYLKIFDNFNENEIDSICYRYGIYNYTINDDGSIDVNSSASLFKRRLTELPLRFRNVNGHFNCSFNNLTSLEGCPKNVGGSFRCSNNDLDSLEWCPINVVSSFDCSDNKLLSLEGSPKHVGVDFVCNNNQLMSLEGCPKSIGGHFFCNDNNITSFEGLPDYIGGQLYCGGNPIYEIWKLFFDYSKIELFNDYDIIRGTDIVLDRLNSFLDDIDKPIVKKIEGYKLI